MPGVAVLGSLGDRLYSQLLRVFFRVRFLRFSASGYHQWLRSEAAWLIPAGFSVPANPLATALSDSVRLAF